MMDFEGSVLVSFLFRVYAIVFFSGIIAMAFIPFRSKPVTGVLLVFHVTLRTGIFAVKYFTAREKTFFMNSGSFFGETPLKADAIQVWSVPIMRYISFAGFVYLSRRIVTPFSKLSGRLRNFIPAILSGTVLNILH
jgi:hypothetical protein